MVAAHVQLLEMEQTRVIVVSDDLVDHDDDRGLHFELLRVR